MNPRYTLNVEREILQALLYFGPLKADEIQTKIKARNKELSIVNSVSTILVDMVKRGVLRNQKGVFSVKPQV